MLFYEFLTTKMFDQKISVDMKKMEDIFKSTKNNQYNYIKNTLRMTIANIK